MTSTLLYHGSKLEELDPNYQRYFSFSKDRAESYAKTYGIPGFVFVYKLNESIDLININLVNVYALIREAKASDSKVDINEVFNDILRETEILSLGSREAIKESVINNSIFDISEKIVILSKSFETDMLGPISETSSIASLLRFAFIGNGNLERTSDRYVDFAIARWLCKRGYGGYVAKNIPMKGGGTFSDEVLICPKSLNKLSLIEKYKV